MMFDVITNCVRYVATGRVRALGITKARAIVGVGLGGMVALKAAALFPEITAGVITVVPYIGSLVGATLGIGLALYQYWGNPVAIGIIVAIFVVGQFMEGNVLTPRLVGKSIGLHPVWLIFALSVFGGIFGFVGLFVAVPVSATIGVLARFATARYQQSALYLGASGHGDSEGGTG